MSKPDFDHAFWTVLARLKETSSLPPPSQALPLVEHTRAFLESFDGAIYVNGYERFSNLGDQALWLSQMRLARYLADDGRLRGLSSLRPALQTPPEAPFMIVFAGGGSLGNRYRTTAHRAHLIESWRPGAIVQMPVSTSFADPGVISRSRLASAYALPERQLVFARDARSRDEARGELGIDAVLVRDLTAMLPDMHDLHVGGGGRLYLMRQDKEAGPVALDTAGRDRFRDWDDIGHGLGPKAEALDVLFRASNFSRLPSGLRNADAASAFRMYAAEALSEIHTARALAFLAGFDEIVTDRLHGVLLARKLGIPGYMLDNDHGKLSRYFGSWDDNGTAEDRIVSVIDPRDIPEFG